MTPVKNYVCGFLFRQQGAPYFKWEVALIQKNRGPANMAGKLNGIGGHIEDGETPETAMTREFQEETSAVLPNWDQYTMLVARTNQDTSIIWFFRKLIEHHQHCPEIKSVTDEPVTWIKVENINHNHIMNNLKWLIPLALDTDIKKAVIEEHEPPVRN